MFYVHHMLLLFFRITRNQKSFKQEQALERALFKYDNFLFRNMAQHKLVFDAIKEDRISSHLQKCILPVGSMFEGCHIAEFATNGAVIQEMDFMLILPDVTAREGEDGVLQLVSLEDQCNPGYANLKVLDATRISLKDTPGMQELTSDPFSMFYGVHNDELFLSHKFVRVFERRVEYAVSMAIGTKFKEGLDLAMKRRTIDDFYPVMTIFLKEPIHYLIWPDPAAWPDSALGALFDTLSAIQGCQNDLDWQNEIVDIAPAILCDVPAAMKEAWLKRNRCWPDQELVEKVPNLQCYVMAKPHPLTENKLLEWRFSFSSAELLLSSAIKSWEKQSLMVLKALRRKHLQEPKVIASYHLKTVLFWVLESLPAQRRHLVSRGSFLIRLLDKLISCVKLKNLPQFFIPENNMFRHHKDKDLKTVLAKLEDMRKNLFLYLTEDLFTTAVTEEREEKEFQETYWGLV